MTYPRILAALTTVALVACTAPEVPDDEPTEAPTDEADTEEPDEAETDETADPVELRILGTNDFHGALEGPSGEVPVEGQDVEAGGAAHLAGHVDRLSDEVDHTTFVHAGDLVGASPLISALFHDEPSIEAMNEAGLDIAGVGNHEFDEGVEELLRLDEGGCHPEEGCREGHEFEGADFEYLAANVLYRDSGEPIMDPYVVREYGEATVGYIGMTLEETPEVVVPSAIEDVTFENEVETVEQYLPELNDQGVDTVIVVLHEGGVPQQEIQDINDCGDVQGPIVEIAEGMPDEVSVVVSGHTHRTYVCEFGGRLVTQAAHAGRVVTAIDLEIDPESGEVVERTAHNHAVTPDVADEAVAGIVDEYAAIAGERAQQVVGEITDELHRGEREGAGRSPIGKLIADAQLAATAEEAGADVAFMNPGGVRDAVDYDDEADGAVTYEQLHTVQPFNNVLTTITLTGAEIHELLEQQFRPEGERDHVLAVSSGFSYVFDPDAERGERVDFDSIELEGEPLEKERDYRVTVNNFLADGGDGFTVLTEGRDRTGGMIDLEALVEYFEANSPIEPPTDERIRVLE